jgi:hypothetical protein
MLEYNYSVIFTSHEISQKEKENKIYLWIISVQQMHMTHQIVNCKVIFASHVTGPQVETDRIDYPKGCQQRS